MEEFSAKQLQQLRRMFAEVLSEYLNQPPGQITGSGSGDWVAGVDGTWDVSALLSAGQRRRQAMFPHVDVLPSELVLSFAKESADAVLKGRQTFDQMGDMDYVSVAMLDGDEIYDFMVANPQHYGVAWKGLPGNERPTYDD